MKRKEIMHRPGIEPGPPAWQASILPLNHRCFGDTFGTLSKIEPYRDSMLVVFLGSMIICLPGLLC